MQTLDLLASLDDDQRAAAGHVAGPALVLAGPGSGKTRTLTHRIANMASQGIDPASILVCTFTKKATTEMEDRLRVLIGNDVDNLQLGTIHAICYRILGGWWKDARRPRLDVANPGLMDTITSMILDKPWQRAGGGGNAIGLDLAAHKVQAKDLTHFWSACKDRLRRPQDVSVQDVPGLVGEDRMREIAAECHDAGVLPPSPTDWIRSYRNAQDTKAAQNVLDFDDMTPMLWYALREDPTLLATCRARIDYILVDEFQDTSWGQWELLRLLAAPKNNIMCVGDVNQSMYGFRFAQPDFSIHFNNYYSTHHSYTIHTNYRSLPDIVSASSKLIDHNTQRIPMDLRPSRSPDSTATTTKYIHVVDHPDAAVEASWIASHISSSFPDAWNSVSVLYRVNSYSAEVELALLRSGIPYRIVGGLSFFSTRPVADMLAYLRLANDPTDATAFKRVLGAPSRFLGKEWIRQVQGASGLRGNLVDHLASPSGNARQRTNARDLQDLIHRIAKLPPSIAVSTVRQATKYDEWLLQRGQVEAEDVSTNTDANTDAEAKTLDALDRMIEVAGGFESTTELLAYVDVVLEQAGSDDDSNRVTLSTIHRAKGLEWPHVYIAGCVDGVLPHHRAIIADNVEEERRIAYVGMTRARDSLVISWPHVIGNRGCEESQFVGEAGL